MNTPCPSFPFNETISADRFPPTLFNSVPVQIRFTSGLITLLGPNGTGKTSTMKALRDTLRAKYGTEFTRYVSAGRMGVLEQFRSDINGNGPHSVNANNAAVGHYDYLSIRKQSESVTGDFMTLETRPDIRLKVEARLQGLFNKTLILGWTQNGLKVDFKSNSAGSILYGAGNEASGLTHLSALLAAIYDDEIKFLLLDEPEVSLHPQLQTFLMKEILDVAGHPSSPGKKCIIVSTHSPSMLNLKTAPDLTSIIFFRKGPELPVQISAGDPILTLPKLTGLILRLSERYKLGFFADSVLLSEGVSDEVVINVLADLKRANFAAGGVQVIPVNGKTELSSAESLFSAIGKKTCMLGDLDILDDNLLSIHLDSSTDIVTQLGSLAFNSLEDLYDHINELYNSLVPSNEGDLSSIVFRPLHSQNLMKRRQIISYLACCAPITSDMINNSEDWEALRVATVFLLDQLDRFNLILIRTGDLESCYICPALSGSKPQKATQEAEYLISNPTPLIDTKYRDVLKAIGKLRHQSSVDEELLLRGKLGAVLGMIEGTAGANINDAQIKAIIENHFQGMDSIFNILKVAGPPSHLEITIKSAIFSSYGTTFTHHFGEPIINLNAKLPSHVE